MKNIFDKDHIREQFGKALELLNTADHKAIFDESAEGTAEQRLHAYCLNIFAEGYRAGAEMVRGTIFSEMDDISTYLDRANNLLLLLCSRYFWMDYEALRNDKNAIHNFTNYYPDIQTLIDVTIEMTGMVDKRLEIVYEILRRATT